MRLIHLVHFVGLAWVALVGVSIPASATTVIRQGIDSLTDASDIVVRGSVERVEGHAEVEGQPFRTEVTLLPETRIVVRFWIISAILAILGLVSLKSL